MARRYDPDRRQRIIDAAIRVVGAKGLAGLSHRSVAAEADVPLGSTTYHFATLDDLMVAALRQANEGFAAVVRDRDALTGPGADLAAGLAALLGEWLGGDRTGVELEYELYLAALRRPALRPVAAEWTDDLAALLAARTDPVTARALVAVLDGVCLQVLLTGTPYDEAYAREILARVAAAPGGPRPETPSP
ncbi:MULTISPECIES: TetR/AcrR family transcriptional regulator [Streptomyces]|uniref:TetR family transcriptional regulator n=1 Tax=Streptomyces doudnae TaxID=3075536 RepID=A0ABD5EV28_9ACTN|nr:MULTISPECIES: TetR family transcriptional regulator [unclassified Streptomyces]MDT0437705.1 TetR family transcriptional regulator [Streptomyces sp. DSM 41981]MYQ68878.1 TetR family transcriptional regulator [Streptomyces sp. SID4950]SCE49729.1 transcriptional regulator, TetR family [Streptomyces sp. SolWspMP-5a-2]